MHGSVSDQEKVRWFTIKGKIVWNEQEQLHYFNGVPATEYRENKESVEAAVLTLTQESKTKKGDSMATHVWWDCK